MVHFDFLHAVVLIIAGCTAGLMNAIAGGGTLVTFSALIWIGLPPIIANATSTVALLPATLGSTVSYRRRIQHIAPWLRVLVPVSLVGGLIGGILLAQTPSRMFDTMVPFLSLFATILFMAHNSFSRFLGTQSVHHTQHSKKWLYGSMTFQFAVAVYGGYFGAGIGILILASLGMLGFKDVHEMNTLKVILGFLINVVAAVYFIVSGLISWPDAFVMACGTIVGGYSGAHFALRVPQRTVRSAIAAIGLAISVVMFYRQFS